MREVAGTNVNFSRMNGARKMLGDVQSRSVGLVRALFGSQAGESSSGGLVIMFAVSLLDYPNFAERTISDIPEEPLNVVVMDGSMKMTAAEY